MIVRSCGSTIVADDEEDTVSILWHDLNANIGSGWKRTSLETAAPTDNEKFTMFAGAAFSLEIDSLPRMRWRSLRLAGMLTLDGRDAAVGRGRAVPVERRVNLLMPVGSLKGTTHP
jgi:hypothetical protein